MNNGGGDSRSKRWRRGRIEIRDLRITATHGVLESERDRAQPFSLDLDVWVDEPESTTKLLDDLRETVDYATIIDVAAKTIKDNSFQLLETCADVIGRAVLEVDEAILGVSVTIRKLRPPVPYDLASVGVRRIATR